jgi:predicted membrane protein
METEPPETEGTEPPKDQNDKRTAGLWSSLSAADKRLGLITFAATLAANIVTVVFVAFGIAAYHADRIFRALFNPQHGQSRMWLFWIIVAGLVVPVVFGLFFKPDSKARRVIFALMVSLIFLLLVFLIFAGLGKLASVK